MDFIDDFIKEYRNNPCLWKVNSLHFKNRAKRQEAYMKLINVASEHGEHYNIERTKQKINNLRCAFRHQLKKYTEIKSGTGKDEPYCPKRRYFESLMFLMEEEKEANNLKLVDKEKDENSKYITEESHTDLCLSSNGQKRTGDSNLCRDEEFNFTKESGKLNKRTCLNKNEFNINYKEKIDNKTNNLTFSNKDSDMAHKFVNQLDDQDQGNRVIGNNINRNRSLSASSFISNDSEQITSNCLKIDCTPKDFQKLLSLACYNIDKTFEDSFSHFGKIVEEKLRSLSPQQALFAEKLITDVLFQGHLGLLSASNVENFLCLQ